MDPAAAPFPLPPTPLPPGEGETCNADRAAFCLPLPPPGGEGRGEQGGPIRPALSFPLPPAPSRQGRGGYLQHRPGPPSVSLSPHRGERAGVSKGGPYDDEPTSSNTVRIFSSTASVFWRTSWFQNRRTR
ncbi:hypothetical protein JCM30394_35170 [Deferrisoma palaeochoriense]